ncbi:MAG: fibrillarin-like rRNA/tRNA 2'-O-methyltransferase [Methanosarcinales archaeon]|nr:fibrillarin-like rRNA/tRNA 2'-O-methyltransferase [Methanosarcinales archaeon]
MHDSQYKLPLLPPNVYSIQDAGGTRLATVNMVPGTRVYSEKVVNRNGIEYRLWSPRRSKLAAMIEKGMTIPVTPHSRILYLGAASGTTASHLSDIVSCGMVFAVEFAPRVMRDLIGVCSRRQNMIPILADATRPVLYKAITGQVDLIYQDVAQRDQAGIANVNARECLKPGGYLIMVIKARSVDSTANPKQVFYQELEKLDEEFEVVDKKGLEPFHRDHLALVARKKNHEQFTSDDTNCL